MSKLILERENMSTLPVLFVERVEAKKEIKHKLLMRKGVCVYGMPGAGKSTFLTRTVKNGYDKRYFLYVDLLRFAATAHIGSTFADCILASAMELANEPGGDHAICENLGTLADLLAYLREKTAIIVLDHVDGLKLSNLAMLDRTSLISISTALNEIKHRCQVYGIDFVFCSRNDHSLTSEMLKEEYQGVYGGFVDSKEILHKICLYTNILEFSASDMQTMSLRGFTIKEVEEVCRTFLDAIGVSVTAEGSLALATHIAGEVGLHPSMVVTLFETAFCQHFAVSSEEDLVERFDNARIWSSGTYKRIFDSIWKYSIRPLYRNDVMNLSSSMSFTGDFGDLKYSRMFTDLLLSGILVKSRDGLRFFSELFRLWVYNEKLHYSITASSRGTLATPQKECRVTVDESDSSATIITANGAVEITGQPGRFFVHLYENKGSLVPRKELLQSVFGIDDETEHNLNKLYQVKKLVSAKIADSCFCIDSISGKGSRKGYTLIERSRDKSDRYG